MKKLLTMLVLFTVMLVFAGIDLCYTEAFYKSTHEDLTKAAVSIELNADCLDNAETVSLVVMANAGWEKGKKRLMMLVNHNLVRYVDEKFVSLIEQVRGNNKDDAGVTVKVLLSFIKDLKEENHLLLTNIL